MFTIVILSFHSQHLVEKTVKSLDRKIPIIIIENSQNSNLKKKLETEYQNVKIIIPTENLGFSKGMNLGIKESKTEYVFLNPADVLLPNNCINSLIDCLKTFNDFAMLAPTYKDETIYKNYEIFSKKEKVNGDSARKYGIKEVDFIDGTFIVKKSQFEKIGLMDENIFIYFETMDLCKRTAKAKKKMFVCDNIKFEHLGGQSHDPNFDFEATLSRNWHYNWSKFYYFKKNFGYFFGLRKIFPNFLRSLKGLIISKILNKKPEFAFYRKELSGIISSIFNKPSNYRPFENE